MTARELRRCLPEEHEVVVVDRHRRETVSGRDGVSGSWAAPTMNLRGLVVALAATVCAPLLVGGCADGGGMPEMGGGVSGMGGMMEGMTEMMRMMGHRSMELPEGIPAGELPNPDSRGARVVAAYCSQCHGIPSPRRHPTEHPPGDHPPVLRGMAHMENMGGRMGRGRGGGMMDVDAPSPAGRVARGGGQDAEEHGAVGGGRDPRREGGAHHPLPPAGGRRRAALSRRGAVAAAP